MVYASKWASTVLSCQNEGFHSIMICPILLSLMSLLAPASTFDSAPSVSSFMRSMCSYGKDLSSVTLSTWIPSYSVFERIECVPLFRDFEGYRVSTPSWSEMQQGLARMLWNLLAEIDFRSKP